MRVENNFNLIRLLAACQVLLVHSLNHLNYEGFIVDLLKLIPGVPVFFFVSGMLIIASWERLNNRPNGRRQFALNRLLRIYPALWICVFLSLFAVWMTGYFDGKPFSFAHLLIWTAGQMSIIQFYNPDFMRGFGVGVLNGALWTISVELQFYILTPVLFWLLKNKRIYFLILLIVSLSVNVFMRLFHDNSDIRLKIIGVSFLPWLYMFMSGILVNEYKYQISSIIDKHRQSAWILSILIYIFSMIYIGNYSDNSSNAIHPAAFAILCIIIILVSNAKLPLHKRLHGHIKNNDYSYGIYIFHVPVLNCILYMNFFNESPTLKLVFLCLCPILIAILSWHMLERHMLALKLKL